MAIPVNARPRGTTNKSRNVFSLAIIVSHFLVCACGIYIGIMIGSFTCPCPDSCPVQEAESAPMVEYKIAEQIVDTPSGNLKFPKTVAKMVVDYATVPRDDFIGNMEIGTPMDETKKGSEDVFVLYTDPRTIPFEKDSKDKPDNGVKHGLDSTKALENCHTVKVILQEPAAKKRQCIAIVPQWESFHVHKFMRIPKAFGKEVSLRYPLRYVSRGMNDSGKDSSVPGWGKHTKPSIDAFVDYAQHFPTALENLKPLLEQAVEKHKSSEHTSAIMKKSKVAVVMVCNKGQAHLFHNFVCNARAKGIDLSRIIMFATDEYTLNLAKELEIPVFYDHKIFGDMPEMAANRYGDRIFSMMMMAKVYCVHLVINLGYDVLFQDVDVVWKKNPLEYLVSEESNEWDMIFQDDGSRQPRYSPYSPNTGKSSHKLCKSISIFETVLFRAIRTDT